MASKTVGPLDPTMDLPSLSDESSGQASSPGNLAVDHDHDLSSENNRVLRTRLRNAALLIFGAFALFLLWHLFTFQSTAGYYAWLAAAHVVVTLAVGTCAGVLFLRRPFSTTALRALEIVVFTLAALFFVFWDFISFREYAVTHGVLPYSDGMWLMLIYTYALFIPNNWLRAALVICSFAAMPLFLLIGLSIFDDHCRIAADPAYCSQWTLKMLVGTATAVAAVYTIGTLRREVFEAKQLGQYKLREQIGSGGMGEVYLAEHQMMKRPCAIKMIRPEKAGDPKNLARFEREVRTSAKLSHWNNIDIFDYGRAEDGTFYYVMEFLPGFDLKKLVEKFGPLPAERVIYLLRQICDALGEAHGIGLIHRDIKPGNIIASERGGMYDVAKLLDFGLAKPQAEFEAVGVTHDGHISGSPLYMAPEQVTNETMPDERSDIYGLGTVAYFMLTGKPPFDDLNPMKVMIKHVNDQPAPPSEIDPAIPQDLENVVLRCLHKEPNRRFQSATELQTALDACAAAGGWTRQIARAWWQKNVHGPRRAAEPNPQVVA